MMYKARNRGKENEMFDDAEAALERILTLVKKCPEPLQVKCFEVLLIAYAQSTTSRSDRKQTPKEQETKRDLQSPLEIPDPVRPRFATFAKRLKVDQPALAALFDFHQDPFTFHAVVVPGTSGAKKTRNVALLLGVKNYLATGNWTADWKEFRAMCVDQNCYDRTNAGKHLNSKEGYFKNAGEGGITLSSAGITAAEKLIVSIINPKEDNGDE
jgi:hypothetical protein